MGVWYVEVESMIKELIGEPSFQLKSMSDDVGKVLAELKGKDVTPSIAVAHLVALFVSVNQSRDKQTIN
jgi:hypothetical protein